MLRAFSLPCAGGSLLAVLGAPHVVLGLELGGSCVRQVPSPILCPGPVRPFNVSASSLRVPTTPSHHHAFWMSSLKLSSSLLILSSAVSALLLHLSRDCVTGELVSIHPKTDSWFFETPMLLLRAPRSPLRTHVGACLVPRALGSSQCLISCVFLCLLLCVLGMQLLRRLTGQCLTQKRVSHLLLGVTPSQRALWTPAGHCGLWYWSR